MATNSMSLPMANSGPTGATRTSSSASMPSSAAPASQAMRMPSPVLPVLPDGDEVDSEIVPRVFLDPILVVQVAAGGDNHRPGRYLHFVAVIVHRHPGDTAGRLGERPKPAFPGRTWAPLLLAWVARALTTASPSPLTT